MAKKKSKIKDVVETVESWVGMGPKAKRGANAPQPKATKKKTKKKAAVATTAKKGKKAVKKKK